MILWGSYVCTQRIHWISFEAFIAEAYVQLAATGSTVLCSSLTLWDFLLLLLCAIRLLAANSLCVYSHLYLLSYCLSCTVLCGALYTACVDASRMVFWDRSLISEKKLAPSSKHNWTVSKYHSTNVYTSSHIRHHTVQCGGISPENALAVTLARAGSTVGSLRATRLEQVTL